MGRRRDYLKYISSLLLFGSNGIVAAKIALPSAEIVFWRTLIGSALLLALFAAGRGRLSLRRCGRECARVALSGVAMGLSWIFLYAAYALVGVSVASLAYYCAPVLVMAASPALFGERLRPRAVAGLGIVLAGVVLANGAVQGTLNRAGLLCGAGSALAHAAMVLLSKKAPHVQGLENATVQLVCSFLTVAVYVGARTGLALSVGRGDLAWLLMLGLVNTGFGCYLYFSALGRLSVASVSILGYLEPLSAVLLAVLLLHERLSPMQWLGAAMVIGGAVLGESGERPAADRPGTNKD